eukprot:TRINITY_DN2942_c0_g1_i2.p1 TRINITY_DN2942_c0_g1~~TRINITY_DN2942_c0_g1_i2.p1  ORF type:complete len:153 (+),score=28.59 TRINITY_DN2942_c0_g1_i2:449-907(+)
MKAIEINRNKNQMTLRTYNNPVLLQNHFSETLRNVKQEEKDLRKKIMEQYKHENPGSSQEKVDAAVFRLTYEMKLKANQKSTDNDRSIYTFKPNLGRTLPPASNKAYYHSGKYEACKVLDEVKEAWSCCLNPVKESQGCNLRNLAAERWILD